MISRNLTSTYMKYRADHKQKKNRFAGSFLTENSSARLLSNQVQSGGSSSSSSYRGDIELDVLPPQWMDIVGETQDNIIKIKDKLTKLQQAQQKRLRQVRMDFSLVAKKPSSVKMKPKM